MRPRKGVGQVRSVRTIVSIASVVFLSFFNNRMTKLMSKVLFVIAKKHYDLGLDSP